ncbi:MAG: DUF4942 domain-containing protein, partial [Phycisphaerae bacterium]|nr:DUF4942 domain-containing protein [Phycisphaerae bacterium]
RELDRGELPELTELNVFAFLEKLQNSLPDMFEQSLQEVFDWLRPCDRWGPHYKTNNKYHVGGKVILGCVMERPWGGHFTVRYDKQQKLHALDNVFHLLDGQGVARYPHDLVTALRAAGDGGSQACETEYFACKWFCNGNLHLTFKRMDLVKELNRRAGASGLNEYTPTDGQIVPAGAGCGGNGDDDNDDNAPAREAGPGADLGPGADAAAGSGRAEAAAGPALPALETGGAGAVPGIGGPVGPLS